MLRRQEGIDKLPQADWQSATFNRANEIYSIGIYKGGGLGGRKIISDANKIQGDDYVRSGYIEPSKLDKDGRLIDPADKKRDITHVVAHRNDLPSEDIEGSLKVIQVPKGGGLESLAAFSYAHKTLDPAFREILEEAHANDPKRGVIEIGGLSRVEKPKSPLVSYELIRDIMQRAVRAKTDELWLITFTEKAIKPMLAAFGTDVVKVAGDTVEIDEENEHVRLIPAVINPCSLIDDLAISVWTEPNPRKREMMSRTLLMMADGLDEHTEMGGDARYIIENEKKSVPA